MIRRRKQRVHLIDPFDSAAYLATQGKELAEKQGASLSNDMDTIHKSLLETQQKLNEVWKKADTSLAYENTNGAEIQTSFGMALNETNGIDPVAPTQEQFMDHEKELTKQKLDAISAHADAIHEALIETQNKLNGIWTHTENSVAKAQAATASVSVEGVKGQGTSVSQPSKTPHPVEDVDNSHKNNTPALVDVSETGKS